MDKVHSANSPSITGPDLNIVITSVGSTAGGVQSHLSTTNSQQRLRPTASYIPSIKRSSILIDSPQARDQSLFSVTSFLRQAPSSTPGLPLSASSRRANTRPWSTIFLRWAALTYCFISVIIFSVEVYKIAYRNRHDAKPDMKSDANILLPIGGSKAPVFEGFSMEQRMSRLSSHYPAPMAFDAFLIRSKAYEDPVVVTACMWTTELDEFDLLYSWASTWRGPISLLIVTTGTPGSPAHQTLLRRLRLEKQYLSLSGISVHLLHTAEDVSPNSFLNIARLFALTSRIMLIPGNASTLPLTLDTWNSQPYTMMPLVVTQSPQAWGSFAALPNLSPLIMPRDYPVWCTDRFFINVTRASDWKECLWQIWIESFGNFGSIGAIDSRVIDDSQVDFTDVIRNRFSVRFRAEVCDVAARTMATFGLKFYKDGKKKLTWLKQACGQHAVEKILKIT